MKRDEKLANDPELLYIDNQGNLLWNYSNHPVTAAALANDGANVVAGISDVLFPGHTNYGG